MKTGYQELTIAEIKQETNNVKLIVFDTAPIPYKAGQYLTFSLFENETELRRSYSIASSPDIAEPLFIGVKRIDNGFFSRKLYDGAEPGDKLITTGAGGVFTLPQNIEAYHQLFFFAAGSGIIPIFSIIKTALHKYAHLELILIYSNSAIEATVFFEDLQLLKAQFAATLKIEFLFSDSQDLFRARLHPDLIDGYLKKFRRSNSRSILYYICGPENYMRLCTYTLRSRNVAVDQIKKEVFHTRTFVQQLVPPDKAPHQVTILRNGIRQTVLVQHPMSILQAAKKQGMILPYSCEVGSCGNCIARCIAGKIWMSNNDVLTETEVQQGFILTCTGYPVGGDATIRI